MRKDKESANLDVLRATAITFVVVMHLAVVFGYETFGAMSIRSMLTSG